MRLKIILLSLLLASPAISQEAPGPAPSGRYGADVAHTSVTWRISHFGLSNYTARFAGVTAILDWNAADPARSKLTVAIDPKSVRTDFPFPEKEDFDRKIAEGADFLAGQPISFVATRIVTTGEATGKMTGDLTFRGQTHPVTLDVVFNGSMAEHPMDKLAKLGFSASAKLDRTQWGLDFALPALGRDVALAIEVEFMAQDRK